MSNESNLNVIPVDSELWIGIDFGTCNTVVSEFADNVPKAVTLMGTSNIIPSAVLYKDPGDLRFGNEAVNRRIINAESVATVFKPHIAEPEYVYTLKYASKAEVADESTYDDKLFIIDTDAFLSNSYILDVITNEGFSGRICVPEYVVEELESYSNNAELTGKVITALDKIGELKNTEFYAKIDYTEPEDSMMTPKQEFYLYAMQNLDAVLVSLDIITRAELMDVNPEFSARIWTGDEFSENLKLKSKTDDGYINLTAFDVSVDFLRNIRKLASERNKRPVNNVVITVPVTFEPTDIAEVKKACYAAGFSRVETELEPLAAAIRYYYNDMFKSPRNVLVYDFGGGTFDTTIVTVTPDAEKVFGADFAENGTSGDKHLGGDDITKLIVNEIYDNLISSYNINMNSLQASGLSKEEYAKNRNTIYDACEKCKINLANDSFECHTISFDLMNKGNIVSYSYDFEKSRFDSLIEENIITRVNEVLDDLMANNYFSLKKEDIDDIILVGGTSSISKLREHLTQYFGKAPSAIGDLATLVSEGAALEAFFYSNVQSDPPDSPEHEETDDVTNNIPGGLTLPGEGPFKKKALKTYGVNIDTFRFDPLLIKGSELPCTAKRTYGISRDNVKQIEFSVFATQNNTPPNSILNHKEISHKQTIKLTDLPDGLTIEDTRVEVSLTLNTDYTMSVEAYLKHEDDTPIGDGKPVRAEIVNAK